MFSGAVLGPVPYETGQPGSAGETQLNMMSDRGRGAVGSGGTWMDLGDNLAAGMRGTMARWSGSTGRSGSRGRQWNKRKKKKEKAEPETGASSASQVPSCAKGAALTCLCRMDKSRPA